eukprot:2414473-Rhodomonas_salina.2
MRSSGLPEPPAAPRPRAARRSRYLSPTPCPVLRYGMLLCGVRYQAKVGCYADRRYDAVRCPVLSYGRLLPYLRYWAIICCYAVSGTALR